MKRVLPWFPVVFLLSFTVCAYAQTIDMKALVAELQQGGYVIVFRHGATNRDQADTDPLNPDNTAKQRLLSEQGREVGVTVQFVLKPPVWARNKISGLAGIKVNYCMKINHLLRFFPIGTVTLLGTAFQQEFATRNA
jgi:hypothetical protein